MSEVEGIAELKRKLLALAGEEQEKVKRTALLEGGNVLRNAWMDHISPAYHNFLTGNYKRSIQAFYEPSDQAVYVGTDITEPPYPYWLEVGTSKMSARPALVPAFEGSKDKIFEEIVKALNILIRKYQK
jgi:HK97 gp10 family phage protein